MVEVDGVTELFEASNDPAFGGGTIALIEVP